jgi:hypothetical protein
VPPSVLPASISSRRCSSAVIGSAQGKNPRLATSLRKASGHRGSCALFRPCSARAYS